MRVVAIALVVMTHTCGYYPLITGEQQTVFLSLCSAISSCAVPLCFMVSGTLFLSPDYKLSVSKIFHKLFKLIVIWIIWSAIYAIIEYPGVSISRYVVRIIKGPFHFWFFEYLAAVYLLSPILKALVSYEEGKYVRYILVCWLILGILKFTLNGVPWHNEETRVLTDKIHFELCDFSGYFLLGYYLSLPETFIKPSKYVWALAFCVFSILQMLIMRYGTLSVTTYNLTIIVAIGASCLFMYIKKAICFQPTCNPNILTKLSIASMGVFIIHPLVMKAISSLFIQSWPIDIKSLVLFLSVLVVSWIFSYGLCLIRFINKWLLSL